MTENVTSTTAGLTVPKFISGVHLVTILALVFGGFGALKNFQADSQLEHVKLMTQIAANSKLIESMQSEQSLINHFNDITHADLKAARIN